MEKPLLLVVLMRQLSCGMSPQVSASKILQGHTNQVGAVAISPDGKTIASSSVDETIKLWDINTGDCLTTLRAERPYEGMNIIGITGLTDNQKEILKVLGAVEK